MDAEFFLAADALWLDLVNTSRHEGRADRLGDLAAWHRWTRACQLPSGAGHEPLRRVHQVRTALAELAGALADGRHVPGGAIDMVNALLARLPGHEQLVREGGSWRLRFAPRDVSPALEAVARSAAATLAEAGAVVRRCSNPSCGRYFVDRTTAGTRHFCSELTCGQGRWADRRRGVLA